MLLIGEFIAVFLAGCLVGFLATCKLVGDGAIEIKKIV